VTVSSPSCGAQDGSINIGSEELSIIPRPTQLGCRAGLSSSGNQLVGFEAIFTFHSFLIFSGVERIMRNR